MNYVQIPRMYFNHPLKCVMCDFALHIVNANIMLCFGVNAVLVITALAFRDYALQLTRLHDSQNNSSLYMKEWNAQLSAGWSDLHWTCYVSTV